MFKLFKYVGKYKKNAILTSLFVAIEVVFEVAIPLVMGYMVTYGIEAKNLKMVFILGGVLVGCAAIGLLMGILCGKNAAIAAAGFVKNLRHAMYYKVQTYSFKNIDKFSTSSIITRITTDTSNVRNAFQMITRIAVRCPLMLLFSLIATLIVSPKLSLIYLIAVPILGICLTVIIFKAHPVFERVFKKYDKLNAVVEENVKGVRVVKSFVREDHEIDKFEETSKSIFKDFTKAERIVALNGPLMSFSSYLVIILLAFIGGKMIIGGNTSVTTGDLISMISYANMILMSLMMLSFVLVSITLSRASAKRIGEILDEESDIKNSELCLTNVANGEIEFKNVNFSYSKHAEKNCLDNINIKIKSGETIGIIGGTGSSKSTLVQLIPRLYDTSTGEVLVGGENVKDYDLVTLRDSVAMVLQKNELFSGTIADNLRWGNPDATIEEIKHACALAQADSFVESFPKQYDTYIEQGGTNVSGGQKQRLCIARALLKKPKILILDDSTSAVDTKTDALIRKAFLKEIPNTTKIIIAQRISSVQDADRIIVLDDGKITGFDTHENLLKDNEIYKEVFLSQTKGGK